MANWYSSNDHRQPGQDGFVIYRDPTNVRRWWCLHVYPIGYWGD